LSRWWRKDREGVHSRAEVRTIAEPGFRHKMTLGQVRMASTKESDPNEYFFTNDLAGRDRAGPDRVRQEP
jgi:hypothetical protein